MEEMKNKISLMESSLRSAEKYLWEDLEVICDDVMREYAERTLAEIRKGLRHAEASAKVFVLTTDWVSDFEYGHDNRVFSTKEKAKEAFDEIVRVERNNATEAGWEIEESELNFEAWEEGCSSENRFTAEITELEVQ